MIYGDLFHKAKSVNVLSKAMLLTAHFHIIYFNWIKYSIAVGLLLLVLFIYLFTFIFFLLRWLYNGILLWTRFPSELSALADRWQTPPAFKKKKRYDMK